MANRASKACGRERRHVKILGVLKPLRECSSMEQAEKMYHRMLKEAKEGAGGLKVLKGLSETDIVFEMKDKDTSFSTPQSRKLNVYIDEQWYQVLRSLL